MYKTLHYSEICLQTVWLRVSLKKMKKSQVRKVMKRQYMKSFIWLSKGKHKEALIFTESGAIIISAFPTPKKDELGHIYEIPTAHCNMKGMS